MGDGEGEPQDSDMEEAQGTLGGAESTLEWRGSSCCLSMLFVVCCAFV